ncbi:MAG TPA: hypothetical protein VEJ87_09755 [Acidimicrobiales bacterium]|nr:hypothetical protein [Acidimicrobiales bacterium]
MCIQVDRGGSRLGWYLVTAEDRMTPRIAQHAMPERAGATVDEKVGESLGAGVFSQTQELPWIIQADNG